MQLWKKKGNASYLEEVASSSEEQLSSISTITDSIEITAKVAHELKDLLKKFELKED